MLWSIIGWLIVGLIAGWLAGEFTRGAGFGLLGNIVVGVLGAVLGGFLAGLMPFVDAEGGWIWSILLAFIGAVILLWLINLFTGEREV